MGDRISISFTNTYSVFSLKTKKNVTKTAKSPIFVSHWDGESLVSYVNKYLDNLRALAKEKGESMPLHRLEPDTVFVDFIFNLKTGTYKHIPYVYEPLS